MIRLALSDFRRTVDNRLDAVLKVIPDNQTFQFGAEFKSRNSPRIFQEVIPRLERAAERQKRLPILVVPYLRENRLEELQQRKLSRIDLSGNVLVTVPGKLLVYRTDARNQFADSAPTMDANRGATSLVQVWWRDSVGADQSRLV